MFKLVRVRDVVRISPNMFDKPLEEAAYLELRKAYEGLVTQNAGIILAIFDVKVDPYGRILHGDGASYHNVEFSAVTFDPFQGEVVEGEVVGVTRSGLYVDLGPIDGFVYIGQVADERAEYDQARQALMLRESRKTIGKGAQVRARIYNVAPMPEKGLRIQLTMRQPGLGLIASEGE
ncbi:MAG: DNA-directed RNA polymerase [Desulfurococcaceae archaeon]